MYEHRRQPLLPRAAYFARVARNSAAALGIIFGALGIGVLGYHEIAGLAWIDSLLNALMILGGMGPVDALRNDAAKLFASAYALFSGIVFITVAGILAAPFVHRFLHRFHLDREEAKR